MYAAITDARDLEALVERVDVVAIGPGLGRTPWARAVCHHVLGCGKPLVIDADALNELAEMPVRALPNAILTPHPGEAGRLLCSDAVAVQRDRLGSVERLAERYGAVAVLKGAGTLVASPGGTSICERGNPGMATPGMGDVLTGVIAGVLAQHRDLAAAARVGVLVHALAGDIAARDGQRGLVASDVLRELRAAVNR
jgi:NAD(P)H-hydrate epimerase